ncbi:DUF4156 domain-containing protein [Lacimicrobium sp. SS2-24]|uniref:DUF4156 domain-containing protein n=1 Tax=Lacimicrobium sp. SS2-24 TaxID=2005569 RepID=UPI00143B774D|nr:DUF4156 domain-containing protein [Lacimicrobium sp. SS2-24]
MKMVTLNRFKGLKAVGMASLLWLCGCASVESLPGSEQIELLSLSQLSQCKKLGVASAQVIDKIAFVERDEEKMAAELLQLARNEAMKMGGNALRIASDIKNGSRDYEVYRCR